MNATQHLVPTPVDAEPTPKVHATRTAPGIFKGTEAALRSRLNLQVSGFKFQLSQAKPARLLT